MDIPRDLFLGGVTSALAAAASPKPRSMKAKTIKTDTASDPGYGDSWYLGQQRAADGDGARNGAAFFTSWPQFKRFGNAFNTAFVLEPELRKEYYRLHRSWDESTTGKQFGEKWCGLIEQWVPDLKKNGIQIQRDDFATFHKYLFWTLATAIYQQTRQPIHAFPPHDDLSKSQKGKFRLFNFHGVPNGTGGGGLDPAGMGGPPP